MRSVKHHIHYYLRARHCRGHGVHSPFAYWLIAGIIEEKHPYYCYDELEAKRADLKAQLVARQAIAEGFNAKGSDPKAQHSGLDARAVKYCLSPADAQLLFRLVNAFSLHKLMDWGGIDEITRLYLQSASSKLKIYPGGQDTTLKPDLLFCNSDLDEPTLSQAILQALNQKTEQSLLVLAGPHRSAGAFRCWQQLLAQSDVRLTVEMKGLGLVFFNPELQKDHYILRR